jgi:hypothetical protein
LLLGTSFLGVLDARPLGLLLGERTLAGRDLPVHLRLIAQPRLALTLLSLLAAFDSLADMLALEPPRSASIRSRELASNSRSSAGCSRSSASASRSFAIRSRSSAIC